MYGKINGKQIKDTSVDLVKIDLSGGQGSFFFATGSYLGAYEVPNIPQAFITKQYADSISSGLDPKESVYLVAVGNISPSGTVSVDGVTSSTGKRILLAGQASPVTNGIYVAGPTAWTRASDSDGDPGNEVSLGNYTFVERGATYSSTGWILYDTNATGATVSPGNDTQLWTQFNGAGSFIWGDGLTNTGNNIYVDIDPSGGLTFSSTKLTLASYLAGNGLTLTSGVLNVGAANGITVGADTVGINYSEAAIGLEGNGLTAAGGKINIVGGTAIGVNPDNIYVKFDPTTIAIDPNGALTVISAGDAILDITPGAGISGNQLSGPTASLNIILTTNGGLTFSGSGGTGSSIQVEYGTVAQQLAGQGLVNNGTTIDLEQTIAGSGLTYSAGVINILLAKGVTFSGDYLFSDAGTILITAGLTAVGVATNSTVQQALTAIDNALNGVGAQQEIAINNNPTGTFLKSVNAPFNMIGFTFSTASDGPPHLYINGVYVKTSSATSSSAAYFSTDGGSTGNANVLASSALFLNANILGFKVDPTDDIVVHYLSKYP